MPNYQKGFYRLYYNTGESFDDHELMFDDKKEALEEFDKKVSELKSFPKLRIMLYKVDRSGMTLVKTWAGKQIFEDANNKLIHEQFKD